MKANRIGKGVFLGLSALLLVTVLHPAAATAVEYTFSIFDIPGATWTTAGGINDLGQIAGVYGTDPRDRKQVYPSSGFIKEGLIVTTFNFPEGYSYTGISDINNFGQIVGPAGNFRFGFIKTGSDYTILRFPDANRTIPTGINDNGIVVGWYESYNRSHGFSWDGSSFTTIDFPDARLTYV